MEAPTSNLTQIDFFCLQPIIIEDVAYRKFLSKDYKPRSSSWLQVTGDAKKLESEIVSELKENRMNHYWSHILQKENAYNLYLHLFNSDKLNSSLLTEICHQDTHAIKSIDLFSLNPNDTGFTLVYDEGTKSFIIIYHISILFDINRTPLKCFDNLFKQIRNILVIDPARNNPNKSKWSHTVEEYCMETIENTAGIRNKLLSIQNSTGYIVSVCPEKHLSKITYSFKDFKDRILSNNKFDDISSHVFPELPQLSQHSSQIIYLGWLYSTIYGIGKKDTMTVITSLILHQNSFIQLRAFYRPYIKKVFKNVKYNFKNLDSSRYLRIFDSMLLSLKQVKQSHFDLTSRQKKWQSDLHAWVWDHWKVDKLFLELEETMDNLESSINRKVSYNSERLQKTQSNILFILAMLQLFTVSAIVKDYFELYSIKVPKGLNQITQDELTSFTLLLPYILIILSTFFIIIVYRHDAINFISRFFTRKSKFKI